MKAAASQLERIAEEPFRIFFPLGILASVIGVLLWPALSHRWISYYPLEAHARWMVLGLGGCFIVGFLGTAGPRLLGTRAFSRKELLCHLSLALAMMVALFNNRIARADLLTGIWFLCVLASLLRRFLFSRRDIPPPGMPLAVLGLLGAAVSGLVFGLGIKVSPQALRFLRLLYFQGFLWLPILGVAPYLLPRFFGKSSPQSFDETTTIPSGWLPHFFKALGAGALLIASFAIEAWARPQSGMILRAVIVAGYLYAATPGLLNWSKVNGLGLALRLIPPCAAGGWLLSAKFPALRVGMLHLMFIGGSGLLMLAAATRVILGHNDRHDRLASPLRWFNTLWFLLMFTAATRLSSDFFPKVRVSHFTYAAVLWTIIVAFWAWKLRRERRESAFLPGMLQSRCPRRREQQNTTGI